MNIRFKFSTWLVWLATRAAPKEMAPMTRAYMVMLEQFPRELAKGRTFGVVCVPWSTNDTAATYADHMQLRALDAAALARSKFPDAR